MIKKTITIAGMLILSVTLIWAAWEGKAAAGSQEDFPSGLFASSDLFPKYTLIEIINLEQNTKSRAVIIENTDANGLLVKVSPDLAAALAIKTGTTVRVRVSVPPIVAEDGADPVLLSQPSRSGKTPRVVAKPVPQAEPKQMVPAKEETPLPVREVAEPVKPKETSTVYIAPPDEVAEPLLPEPKTAPAPSAVSEVPEPTEPPPQSENREVIEKPILAVAPIKKPPVREDAESIDAYMDPVRQVPEITPPEKTDSTAKPISVAEVEPVSVEDKKDEHIAEPEETSEPAATDTESPADEPEVVAVEPEEVQPEQPEQVEEPQNEPEVVIAEESPAEEDTAESESVEQHVMLVPSEPKVPIAEDLPSPKETEKESTNAVPTPVQPAKEPYATDTLKQGSFYVQIGQFKDTLNVEGFVQLYGNRYPVAVEKFSTAKDVFYKVYVGPLQKDEGGAALETFQKLGFRDAFLKKAP